MRTLPRVLVGAGTALSLSSFAFSAASPPSDQSPLDDYNVVWTSPSESAAGSMPIGNGDVGLNVWTEPGGDVVFFVSRTDAWSEACRLLKLGRIRVHITPNPFPDHEEDRPNGPGPFRQTLNLRAGAIEIVMGDAKRRVSITIFVDPDQPVVHVLGDAASPVSVRATVETWRTEARKLNDNVEELRSSWTMHSAPSTVEVWESKDEFRPDGEAVVWYHRNERSIVPVTLKQQGLEGDAAASSDPLIHRTFGGRLCGTGFERVSVSTIATRSAANQFSFRITTHTTQTSTADQWTEQLRAADRRTRTAQEARASTAAWWDAFWKRSWIFIENGDAESAVPANAHPLRIGIDSSGSNRFAGEFGEIQMLAGVLDIDQIAERAASQMGAAPRAEAPRALATWEAGAEPGTPAAIGSSLPPLDGFTITAWIKPALELRSGRILDKITPGAADGFLLDVQPDSTLRLIVGGRTLTAPRAVTPGKWNHVAASMDAVPGAMCLYVDGKRVAHHAGTETAGRSRITRGYVLQRWMLACAGRGAYPIKFNGSIFTVEPRYSGGPDLNPDYRRWGDCYWWQNSRLPYYPMLAAGDFEMMQPLFSLYTAAVPLCEARAERYHHVRGVYFPETMTIFGTYSNGDYGWDRTCHEPSEILCPWWQYAWNLGPELVAVMLDYWEYTRDERFLVEQLLPMARGVLAYFDSRFSRDAAGKLVISPTQALETHWNSVTNDAPCVAGLHDVLARLRRIPDTATTREDRGLWARLADALPAVPVIEKDGVRMLAAAQSFDPVQQNVETPELYAVFPFRLYGIGKPDIELARAAYGARPHKFTHGWSQDGQFAALLGLTDEARANITAKSHNSNPGHRFPAMWGPNFDWVPDQDHGSNLMTTLQLMLLQCDGDKILLLPAWPVEWDVSFRLHAPRETVVDGEYRGGRIVRLDVTPRERRGDVVIARELADPNR